MVLVAGMASTAVITTGVTASLMIVMIAADIRIITQAAGKKSCNCVIRISVAAAVKPDACLRQCVLSAAADAAADQSIDSVLNQKAGKSAMTAAIGIDHFCIGDRSVFHFINLKLFGVSEMLKNFSVFISNCDFHNVLVSFFFYCYHCVLPPALSASGLLVSFTDPVIPTTDQEALSVNDTSGKFFAGTFIDLRDRGTGNIHLGSTLAVCLFLKINQADDFVFIQRQSDSF